MQKVALPALAVSLVLSAAIFAIRPAGAASCDGSAGPGLDWSECVKRNLMLQGTDFKGANLYSVDFSQTDLSNADLSGANLEKATFVRASLAGAQLSGAKVAKIEAYRSNFSGVSAEGVSFAGAELQRSDLTRANLAGADFSKAELGRVNFTGATLTGVNFSFANLSRADLSGAVLEGPIAFDQSFLYLTRVEGLDLSKATGLEQSQVDLACGNEKTKLPGGVTVPASWPCTFD